MHPLWDKLVKMVGELYPEDIVRFAMEGLELEETDNIKIIDKYEQEKVAVEYQVGDINFWIFDQKACKRKLLNIEVYSSWKEELASVVFTRNAILTRALRKEEVEVITVVVILDKSKPRIGSYEVELGGKKANKFTFPIITYSDPEKILEKYISLTPFILKVDINYKEKVIKRIGDERVLRETTALVLNRMGVPMKEALEMVNLRFEEFSEELLSIHLVREVVRREKEQLKLELEERIERERQEKEKVEQEKEKLEERIESVAGELRETIANIVEIKFGKKKKKREK